MNHTLQALYAHLAIPGNYLNETGEYPRARIRWHEDGAYLVGRHKWEKSDKMIKIFASSEYELCNAQYDAKEKGKKLLEDINKSAERATSHPCRCCVVVASGCGCAHRTNPGKPREIGHSESGLIVDGHPQGLAITLTDNGPA